MRRHSFRTSRDLTRVLWTVLPGTRTLRCKSAPCICGLQVCG
jgi:hypothetical protein